MFSSHFQTQPFSRKKKGKQAQMTQRGRNENLQKKKGNKFTHTVNFAGHYDAFFSEIFALDEKKTTFEATIRCILPTGSIFWVLSFSLLACTGKRSDSNTSPPLFELQSSPDMPCRFECRGLMKTLVSCFLAQHLVTWGNRITTCESFQWKHETT